MNNDVTLQETHPELMQRLPAMHTALVNHVTAQVHNPSLRHTVRYTLYLLGTLHEQGEVCLILRSFANTRALQRFGVSFYFPAVEVWHQQLVDSGIFAQDVPEYTQANTPLVLLVRGALYLTKHAQWFYTLFDWLHMQSERMELLDQTLPLKAHAQLDTDLQERAVYQAFHLPLSLIIGGPGTGKTTTMARLVTRLRQHHGDDYRLLCAAPTGKAANRLHSGLALAGCDTALTGPVMTLHRLLQWSNTSRYFKVNAQQPLQADCVIIDEASMIDLGLFVSLIRALPIECKLVLVGDPNQLPSVYAGHVLAWLVSARENPRFNISHAVVELTVNYRFSSESGIYQAAQACLQGNSQAFMKACEQSDMAFHSWQFANDIAACVDKSTTYFKQLTVAHTAQEALNTLSEHQWLCATKHDNRGSHAWNTLLYQSVHKQQSPPQLAYIHHGTPIIVTKNDYTLGVFNGDIGLVWREHQKTFVVFAQQGRENKRILAQCLTHWALAYAITVHKSQGSECDHAVIILPDAHSPLANKQLLYTAITRAKKRCTIIGDRATIDYALQTKTQAFSVEERFFR